MAPESKQPRKPRKSSPPKTGARRGRPPKNRDDEETPKRPDNMPLPRSLLDTTIADGEEYRPGSGAPARQAEPAPAPEPVSYTHLTLPPLPSVVVSLCPVTLQK